MAVLIAIIGAIIATISLLVIVFPRVPLSVIDRVQVSTGLKIAASFTRIGLGVCLILGAPRTDFPQAIQVIGWLTVIVGIALLPISNTTFQRIISWFWSRSTPSMVRLVGLVAFGLGSFLVWASL
jgi:uncharacterized membrane protein